jgi:hypothetical protein
MNESGNRNIMYNCQLKLREKWIDVLPDLHSPDVKTFFVEYYDATRCGLRESLHVLLNKEGRDYAIAVFDVISKSKI